MFKKLNRKSKGFTLLEALIVMILIALAASIALPAYLRAMERVRADQSINTLQYIAGAQKAYKIKNHKYAEDASSLALTLRNSEGETVSGTAFSGPYFNYTIYGDLQAKAVASRSNGEYSFTIDYATGEIQCEAASSSICSRYGVSNYADTGSSGGGGGSLPYYQHVQCNGGYVCVSGYYIARCREWNQDHTACTQVVNAPASCKFDDYECLSRYHFTGNSCNADNSKCIVYEDGVVKKFCRRDGGGGICSDCLNESCSRYTDSTCQANETLSGCALVCGVNANCTSDPVCDRTGYCAGRDSKGVEFKCILDDSTCMAETGYTGTMCMPADVDPCATYENGQIKYLCDKNAKTCVICNEEFGCDPAANGDCPANEDFSGCAAGSGSGSNIINCTASFCTGTGLNGEFTCKIDDFRCVLKAGYTGALCDEGGKCVNYEEGKAVTVCTSEGCDYCRKDVCDSSYGTCAPNADLTGCAAGSGSGSSSGGENIINCVDNTCSATGSNGKPFECTWSDIDCVLPTGFTGTLCSENGECFTFENGEVRTFCEERGHLCKKYMDGAGYGLCVANANLTGCGELIVACEDGGMCKITDDFGKTYKCEMSDFDCVSGTSFTGTLCESGDKCYSFEGGNVTKFCTRDTGSCVRCEGNKCAYEYGWCMANANLTDCATSSGSGTGSGVNVVNCDPSTHVCIGNGASGQFECNATDTSCMNSTGYTGIMCDGGKICYAYENGAATYVCEKDTNLCRQYDGSFSGNGGYCTANATYSGCAATASEPKNLINCTNSGMCSGQNYQGQNFSCNLNNADFGDCVAASGYTGTVCNTNSCYNIEYGQIKSRCGSEGCEVYNGNVVTSSCNANAYNTGCALRTINCSLDNGQTCIAYEADGTPIRNGNNDLYFANGDTGAMEVFGLTGTICNKGTCISYENGVQTVRCQNGSQYCDIYNNGSPVGTCPSGYTIAGTTCAYRTVQCSGKECDVYENGTPSGYTCPAGDISCYASTGASGTFVSDNGRYITIKNGMYTLECRPNENICYSINHQTGQLSSVGCTANATYDGCDK